MECCNRYCAAEANFDRKRAEGDLKRYRRRGADVTTRLILEEIRRWPLEGRTLLDIGGGIGVIGAELSDDGLAGITMVEASPSYLEVARRETESGYRSDRAKFIFGDFAAIANTLSAADVVTLDRVVCCYPDGEAMLRQAAAIAGQLLAFTYPRDRWYVRAMIALENFLRRLKGNKFRAFVHSPHRMREALETSGLARAAERKTLVWMLDLYRRES